MMILLGLPWILAIAAVRAVDTLVELDYAKYDGVANENTGVTNWLGMRFAAAPVDDLRFAPPKDPKNEGDDVIAADKHGLICRSTPGTPESDKEDEDCLFVDVYAPTNASADEPLPVYFYISGGGFNSIADANLNGTRLIRASDYNMVVVTFNYRVGLFGFLASAEVESDPTASVNNGLHDQRKALEWVQKYIHQFGGDPGHVTIGGASAGAASVFYHLTAYEGRNDSLFSAAAAESQSFATVLTIDESQYQYEYLTDATNCSSESDTLSCLRGLSAADIQRVNKNIPFPQSPGVPAYMYNVVIDNGFVPDLTYRLFAEGKFLHVPVIFGDDTNGGTNFVTRNTSTRAEQDAYLRNQFPYMTTSQLDELDATYANPNQTCPATGCLWRKASDIYGNLRYMCPGLYISAAYAAAGVPSWNYRYNIEDPAQIADGVGVPHVVERAVIWGYGYADSYKPGEENAWAVPWIQGYWTSFIRSYDPNAHRLADTPEWEAWGADDEEEWKRFLFETEETTGMEIVNQTLRGQCEYAFSIGVEIRQK